MTKKKIQPLTADELVEIEELLSSIGEAHEAMSLDELDGYLTCLVLDPHLSSAPAAEWLPFALDSRGEKPKDMPEEELRRLEALVLLRRRDINATVAGKEPIDPVILTDDDGGTDGPDELASFASGFLACMDRFPSVIPLEDKAAAGAALGVLRHLPEEARGSLAPAIETIIRESPLPSPEEALDDLAACVAEIAEITRGLRIRA